MERLLNQQPAEPRAEPPSVPTTELEWLARIEGYLHTIKNILVFFTVLAILAAVAQACTLLTQV